MDEEGLNLSYPSIRGTSRRSWATTSACFSGDVIRRMSAELSWEIVESQIIKRVNSSATKHNKKNQCWRRNFRPEINKTVLKLSWLLSINCKHELVYLLPTLVLFVVLSGTAIHTFDYFALNHLTKQLSRLPSNYVQFFQQHNSKDVCWAVLWDGW